MVGYSWFILLVILGLVVSAVLKHFKIIKIYYSGVLNSFNTKHNKIYLRNLHIATFHNNYSTVEH